MKLTPNNKRLLELRLEINFIEHQLSNIKQLQIALQHEEQELMDNLTFSEIYQYTMIRDSSYLITKELAKEAADVQQSKECQINVSNSTTMEKTITI